VLTTVMAVVTVTPVALMKSSRGVARRHAGKIHASTFSHLRRFALWTANRVVDANRDTNVIKAEFAPLRVAISSGALILLKKDC
jgi:hypothetical protein